MKTSFSSHARLAGAALLVSSAFSLIAHAGPGAQYWQKNAPAKADAAPTAAVGICPGSTIVPVTVMRAAWSNGRGPLVPVQIGTKRVCTVCPVTAATISGWPNGRGPSAKSEQVMVGATHDCTGGCSGLKGS